MVIAGSDRTTRRRAGRRQRDLVSFPLGIELGRARTRAGLGLDALQDRTGVSRADLERLEEGDLSRFPDEHSALVAVRRYVETLGLEAGALADRVHEGWRRVLEGAGPDLTGLVGSASRRHDPLVPALVEAGHTSRYPGDTSHLRAFTQTAQVPRVSDRTVGAPAAPALRFDTTDAVPVTWRGPRPPRPAPLALRLAVWCTVVLLVLSGAGLAVHHWRPGWLVKVHLLSAPAAPGGHRSTTSTTTPAATRAPVLSTASTATGTTTVHVRASSYSVVVATQAPCWIRVTDPTSFAPVFSGTVPAGTTKTFASGNGELSVEVGASRVLMSAQIDGRSVTGWVFAPPSAPYVVNFRSVSR